MGTRPRTPPHRCGIAMVHAVQLLSHHALGTAFRSECRDMTPTLWCAPHVPSRDGRYRRCSPHASSSRHLTHTTPPRSTPPSRHAWLSSTPSRWRASASGTRAPPPSPDAGSSSSRLECAPGCRARPRSACCGIAPALESECARRARAGRLWFSGGHWSTFELSVQLLLLLLRLHETRRSVRLWMSRRRCLHLQFLLVCV